MKETLRDVSGMCIKIRGIEVKRAKAAGTIELSPGQYTLSVLERTRKLWPHHGRKNGK